MAPRGLKAPLYGAGCLMKESIGGVLLFGAVSDGGYRGTCSHVLRAGPLRKLLEKQPPQTNWRSRCFLTWLRAVSEFSLMTPQYGQKGKLAVLPLDVERLPHEASVSVEVT